MARLSPETKWMLVAAGSAMLAGVATRKLLEAGWQKTTNKEPPDVPEISGAPWSEALTWTAATSLLIGLSRLFARQGIAAGWRRMTGHRPPRRRFGG